jgi:hypothetical protein
MNTTNLKSRSTETAATPDRFKSRMTVVFYLVTILTGGVILFAHGRSDLKVDLIATVCYMAVTAVFYQLSR